MNLPIFDNLNTSPIRSTYYTFSKALKDLDRAVTEGKEWYFTKVVGLNLPIWASDRMFFRFRKTSSNPAGDIQYYTEQVPDAYFPECEAANNSFINPNVVIPKLMTYYMENLIRQSNIGNNSQNNVAEYITELAFWKLLNMMGISTTQIYDTSSIITYVGDVSTVSFTEIANNHGWAEILVGIPTNCPLTIINTDCWDMLSTVDNIINADNTDDCAIYDKDNNFGFDMTQMKRVLNFDEIESRKDFTTQQQFQFNALLLFYTDDTGINKLHGIDFIMPFEETLDGWRQESLKHVSNTVNNFGYSFRFNMKSCTNRNTQETVYELNENSFYSVFDKAITSFDTFLEFQRQQGNIL